MIAGNLAKAIPQNEFIATTREYADFELRLKARLVDGKGNGGVQFRSQRENGTREMIGYQADCAGGHWGGVYDESRRRKFLGTRLNVEALAKVLKPDGWNSYVIRCEGSRVRVWLNDLPTLDYTENDKDTPLKGRIGLQIHEGDPSEAWYKDVEIEELKPVHRN